MKTSTLAGAIVLIGWLSACAVAETKLRDVAEQGHSRHRTVILTDIEADPDDTQSLIRLLLYANEIDIEGIVATTSVWKKSDIAPESIRAVIDRYGEVYGTLSQHAPGYPTAESLHRTVLEGQPSYGMASVGPGKDTEGSNAIIRLLASSDDRPLWVSIWGGANTLAQALYTIRETRTPEETASLIAKLRVYAISDQDDSGIWMREQFPDLFYIVSPGDYGRSTWIAITRGFEGFNDYISNQWIAENLQQGHGPLGSHYPDVVWGLEGDTPAFLSLIPNGLNVPDHPDWGGWGGRYELRTPSPEEIGVRDGALGPGGVPLEPEPRPIWTDTEDTHTPWSRQFDGRTIGPDEDATQTSNKVTLLRWRDDFQRDFAARMDWTIFDYYKANHPPVPVLDHPAQLSKRSGEHIRLSASGTFDPDGDSLSFHWFNYAEAGSMELPVDLGHAVNDRDVWFRLPDVEKTEEAHFILRVTDKGEPALSRYARVIVTIEP